MHSKSEVYWVWIGNCSIQNFPKTILNALETGIKTALEMEHYTFIRPCHRKSPADFYETSAVLSEDTADNKLTAEVT